MLEAGGLALVISSKRVKGALDMYTPAGWGNINLVLSAYPSNSNSIEDCNDKHLCKGIRPPTESPDQPGPRRGERNEIEW